MKHTYLVLITLLPLAVAGCVSDAQHVEDDFGKSVKQMVAAQIYDPAAASNPDVNPPLLLDGEVAGTSTDEYREAAKRKDQDTNSITFSVN